MPDLHARLWGSWPTRRYRSVREPVPPTIYIPLAQFDERQQPAPASAGVSVRAAAGPPALLARAVNAATSNQSEPRADIPAPRRSVNASLTQEWVVAMLSGFFGALALLLAGLGLYGVTRPRLAADAPSLVSAWLGAGPGSVVWLVLSRVLLVVGVGVVVGSAVGVWLFRFVATLLYGLRPRDPMTLVGAALTLAAAGALAGWLPALRAAHYRTRAGSQRVLTADCRFAKGRLIFPGTFSPIREGIMTARRPATWLVLFLFVSILGVAAHTQQTQTKPFQPEVGQPGKDVVWVPTPQVLVDKMLDMAKVTPKDFLMDLGSGDGRTVITAAKRGTRAMGIEYNPDMVDLSRKNAAAAGVTDKATFVKADLFETDLSKATVITMFLLPSINMKLRPKILDLKPGTRIVSNTFTMEDWEADETNTVESGCENSWCTALFWIVPAKVEGTWKIGQGDLKLTQKFQMLSGTLGSAPIANGRLRGDEISFSAGGAKYTGRVNGNTIRGTITGGPGGSWTATRQ